MNKIQEMQLLPPLELWRLQVKTVSFLSQTTRENRKDTIECSKTMGSTSYAICKVLDSKNIHIRNVLTSYKRQVSPKYILR